ncbi:MAG: endonuclease [Bacteroidia bacterium]
MKCLIQIKIFCLVLFSGILNGQTLSTDLVNFGEVETGAPDSFEVVLTNNTSDDLDVQRLISLQLEFQVMDTALTITPSDNYSFWIRFAPRHNISYNSEIILDLAGPHGTLPVDVRGVGKYPGTYYSSTQNLSEEPLKSALKTLISGHTSFSYNVARDKMYMEIDNQRVNGQGASSNTLECVYTGRLAVGYNNRIDAQNNYNFNTEHTFPQSLFNSQEPMRTDLFHLFPTDVGANSERGNKPFGNVSNPSWNVGGSQSNSTAFEPRDEQKGASARALFYFVIRYQDYSNFVQPQETVLREWAASFPPDEAEKQRNEDIFTEQKNRNPFIDHPEFLKRIQRISGTSTAPVVIEALPAEDTIDLGGVLVDSTAPYRFHLYAGGNSDLTISNAQFDQPGFTMLSSAGSISPGEVGVFVFHYTPTVNGQINATLTLTTSDPDNSALDIPVTGLAVMTGVADKKHGQPAISISQRQLSISMPDAAETKIEIFDLSGKIIFNSTFNQSSINSPFPFSSGIYFYRAIRDQRIFTGKIIAH